MEQGFKRRCSNVDNRSLMSELTPRRIQSEAVEDV
jgi:hypothetical protein